MKKINILLIGLIFIFSVIGCSKESKEPYLNLIHNGYTNTTLLVEYQENDDKSSIEGTVGTNYLKLKQYSKLEYKSSKSIDKCSLLIQNVETKEKVKEVILDTHNVITNIAQGKYIYTFFTEWKNGNAKFIKYIEIE